MLNQSEFPIIDAFKKNFNMRQYSKSLDELYQLGMVNADFDLGEQSLIQVQISYSRLLTTLQDNPQSRIYGVHTFFGENVRNSLDPEAWKNTQSDLLEYLQVGTGKALPENVVRRALRLQAIKVAHGLSGIHPVTYEGLIKLAEAAELPVVPREGSLGASGDLISMAHAVAPIFKETIRGPRDVLGLVNTNSMMASWAIELHKKVEELLQQAIDSTALVSIAVGAGAEHFAEGLSVGQTHSTYKIAGEKVLASRNKFLVSPKIIEGTKSLHQARYSIRCAPQVIGHCLDLMSFAEQKILSEAVAVADNPIVLKDGTIWHGGLFYAIGLAAAADSLTEVSYRLAELLDRQTLVLMDSNLNGGLPDNLRKEGFSHCKGIHQLLSALFQKVKAQSTSSRHLSFSCEGNNQDLVPCGMTALNNLHELINTVSDIARGSLFCSLRGAQLRSALPLSEKLKLQSWSTFHPNHIEEILK